MCEGEGVPVEEKRKGSTRRLVFRLRSEIAVVLMFEKGMYLENTALVLGVTTPATWRAIRKSTN
jgi:predicted transcriptional regulator